MYSKSAYIAAHYTGVSMTSSLLYTAYCKCVCYICMNHHDKYKDYLGHGTCSD